MAHDEVSFAVQFRDQKTHHQGKCPAIITLESKTSRKTGKVMYKPRGASLDCAVLLLFQDMGPLDVKEEGTTERASQIVLPHYKVLSLGPCSFWQYIEGTDMVWKEPGRRGWRVRSHAPDDFIKNSSTVGDEHRKQLRAQLLALESVASAIHLYDLHGENVLLDAQRHIVPIDLECVAPGHPTGLLGGQAPTTTVELSPDQHRKIEVFQQEVLSQATRLVCISTSQLTALRANQDPHILASQAVPDVAKNLGRFGYKLTNEENLRLGLYRDHLHGDIPYFSAQRGIVHSGLPEEGLAIGRLIT